MLSPAGILHSNPNPKHNPNTHTHYPARTLASKDTLITKLSSQTPFFTHSLTLLLLLSFTLPHSIDHHFILYQQTLSHIHIHAIHYSQCILHSITLLLFHSHSLHSYSFPMSSLFLYHLFTFTTLHTFNYLQQTTYTQITNYTFILTSYSIIHIQPPNTNNTMHQHSYCNYFIITLQLNLLLRNSPYQHQSLPVRNQLF